VKAAHWASRHARSILFMLVAMIAGGIFAARSLPVTLFPHVNFPRIRVDFDAGDRPAERMAVEVTSPAEEALRAVDRVAVGKVAFTSPTYGASITLDHFTAFMRGRLTAKPKPPRRLLGAARGRRAA